MIRSIASLEEALADADVDAASYNPKKPPEGVTEEQQEAIALAASEVGSQETPGRPGGCGAAGARRVQDPADPVAGRPRIRPTRPIAAARSN